MNIFQSLLALFSTPSIITDSPLNKACENLVAWNQTRNEELIDSKAKRQQILNEDFASKKERYRVLSIDFNGRIATLLQESINTVMIEEKDKRPLPNFHSLYVCWPLRSHASNRSAHRISYNSSGHSTVKDDFLKPDWLEEFMCLYFYFHKIENAVAVNIDVAADTIRSIAEKTDYLAKPVVYGSFEVDKNDLDHFWGGYICIELEMLFDRSKRSDRKQIFKNSQTFYRNAPRVCAVYYASSNPA